MTDAPTFEIFLAAPPGLETALLDEAAERGFAAAAAVPGGVTVTGGWPEIWRANLELRGASRVLVRIASFMAFHLAQLDKRARKVPWAEFLRPGQAVKVEATCRASKIYHAGAAADRIGAAITDALGPSSSPDAPIRVLARIEDNRVTISLDSSGDPLHRRGHKEAVGKAPMRETLAALFLRQCGYRGGEPVVDPMCGSGTFVIEAAEIASGLLPGRIRRFAFEEFAGFDPAAWQEMRAGGKTVPGPPQFHGFDRDAGAISAAEANAARAGVADVTAFCCQPIGALAPPGGPPGLVIVNPPYGARIGNKKPLYALYGSFGEVMKTRFSGWRVGLVTSDPALAHATTLPFAETGPPVDHGGIRIRLYRTGPLG
ncbi:MAG: class I SAM-dependent RNA methyltransferase [Rhodobacteraceae bacterium]|nr:class I SAM-dependent RNA methyltransferase [Paracoccaceae bacterium]